VATNLKIKVHISGHSDKMSKISGQLLISGQFQDICEISGISGQLGALPDVGLRMKIFGSDGVAQSPMR